MESAHIISPRDPRILAFRIIEKLFFRSYIQVKRFIPRLYYYLRFLNCLAMFVIMDVFFGLQE
jgi:hypothetical protein